MFLTWYYSWVPWRGVCSPFLKYKPNYVTHPLAMKRWLSAKQEEKGMSFASPSGSLGFCKYTLSLSVSLKCYLSILLRAAVNRARAVLHRWWEGKLHNSSCPITLLPFPFCISLQKQKLIYLDRREMSSADLKVLIGKRVSSTVP